nr:TerC family protein [Rhodoplanes roseus]
MWETLTNDIFTSSALTALAQVVMIDLVLAGDNAIVIGLAAAGLPKDQRARAILLGIGAATILRIGFAAATTQLLQIVGLLLAGGLLLLWVCWKMWRELQAQHVIAGGDSDDIDDVRVNADGSVTAVGARRKTFAQAAWQIVVADISMSLDNVLAVAGAAREHPWVLIFGLGLSIALMGIAANYIASLLQRHRWIAYVGLVVILYVAAEMIWRGGHEVWPMVGGLLGLAPAG